MFTRQKNGRTRLRHRVRGMLVVNNPKQHVHNPIVNCGYLKPSEYGHIRSRATQYSGLVDNEDHFDTQFECTDGTTGGIWGIVATSGAKIFRQLHASDKSNSPFSIARDPETGARSIKMPYDTKTMKAVLSFVYTGRFPENENNYEMPLWRSLVIAADFLDYPEMLNLLSQIARETPCAVDPNVISDDKICELAKRYKSLKVALRKMTKTWARLMSGTQVKNPEFGALLSTDTVIALTQSLGRFEMSNLHKVLPIRTRSLLGENEVFCSFLLSHLDRQKLHLFFTMPLRSDVNEMSKYHMYMDPVLDMPRLVLNKGVLEAEAEAAKATKAATKKSQSHDDGADDADDTEILSLDDD